MRTIQRSLQSIAALAAAFTLGTSRVSAEPDAPRLAEWEFGTVELVYPGFEVPCLEETLLVIFELPYMSHRVSGPNGVAHSFFKYIPGTPSRGGHITLIGETSGRVYQSQSGTPAFNAILHLGPGEVYRDRSNERYLSEDGIRLTINWHTRFTVNANGELIADLVLLDCRVR